MPKPSIRKSGSLQDKPSAWLSAILAMPERRPSRWYWSFVVAVLVLIIGALDYFTGYEASVMVFYLLPVAIAVVMMGWIAGVSTAVGSMAISLIGDMAAGARYQDPLTPWWNALIVLVTYLVVVWLMATLISINAKLQAIHRELEERVRQRTEALTQEIAERERLEKVVLEIGERERSNIGHDLHDGLGQYLTGTALAGKILADKLEARQAGEAADARKVVEFVEQAIEQTRGLAKGLLLAEIDGPSLTGELAELAKATEDQYQIACVFRSHGEIKLSENGAATHLYRIAQEALRNAVRHARARGVEITLTTEREGLVLSVSDDGIGLPAPDARGQGLGLRIMAHRAAIIGANFTIETPPEGGTLISCRYRSTASST
jgi:signal transduction histidine kinase